MLTPTAEVEVPTDLVRRLLAGQYLPHEELTEGDGAFPPASRPTAPTGAGHFTNRLRPGESLGLWRGSGRVLQPPHPLGGARRVENNVVTSALPLNGLEMNSCAVDGLVVASGVPRYQ